MEQNMIRRVGLVLAAVFTLATFDVRSQEVAAARSTNADDSTASEKPSARPAATPPADQGEITRIHEEIEVTALKRGPQKLLDVPQPVQAFSGSELELRMVNTPVAAVDLVPGASAGVTGGAGTQRYNLRGTGAMGSAGDLAIGFYIDDVPYYSPGNPFGPAIRFFDLESVEVLRGPQGTLYGQGALGGAIIIRTAQPDLNQYEARARIVGSDMKEGGYGWKTDMSLSAPLIQDELAFRLTAGREQRPGLAESPDFPGRSNIDDGTAWDYRLKLLYRPTDRLSLRATHWESNDSGNFSPVYSTVAPPTITGTGGIDGLTHNKTGLSSFVVDWDTAVGSVRSSSSYTQYDDLYRAGSAFDALIGGQLVPFLLNIDAAQQSNSFNQEVTLSSSGLLPWAWIAGGNYVDGRRTADVAAEITSPPGIPTSVSKSVTDSRQLAFFGEISRELMGGRITPLVGLRWHSDRRDFLDQGANVFHTGNDFSGVSPRFNVRVRPSSNADLYVNVAKGFRSGTFNTQSNVDIAALFGLSTAITIPEATVWSYEFGASLRFPGGGLLVQPAIYHNDFTNYPVEAQIANAGIVVPVKKVGATGVDLIAQYMAPIRGLSLSFTGNYNRTRPHDSDPALAAQVPALAEGKQLPYVPRWSSNLAAGYDRGLNDALAGFVYASMTRRDGQVDFITGRWSPTTNDLTLRVGVRETRDRWSVSLFGKNLTDDRGPAVTTGGLQIRYERRTIGTEVTAKFR